MLRFYLHELGIHAFVVAACHLNKDDDGEHKIHSAGKLCQAIMTKCEELQSIVIASTCLLRTEK
jgi:hypothetical protein